MAGSPKLAALGAELRRHRQEAGLSIRALADRLGITHTTIRRWENGETAPRATDVSAYLVALQVPLQVREELIELIDEHSGRHWINTGSARQQMATLLELERDAIRICNVSPLIIPGLLQTPDYARAIMRGNGLSQGETETRVAIRLGRQNAITRRENPVQLSAVVDETALLRNIGGAGVMVGQLRSLVSAARWSNVDLRVMPVSAGWHPLLEGGFIMVEFSDRSPVVALGTRHSTVFFHEPRDVDPYREAEDEIRCSALSPGATIEVLEAAIDRMETLSGGEPESE